MSIMEILQEANKLTVSERRELLTALKDAEQQDIQAASNNEKPFVSFAEVAAKYIGSLDFGPGDLATNKEHLKGLGRD